MNQGTSQETPPIVGEWKLVSFEVQRPGGAVQHPFGKRPEGFIVYTDSGRMAVQMMRSDRLGFASGDPLKGAAEEIKAANEGFIGYYGSYVLDEQSNFVVHQLEQSWFPNWEGTEQKRFFEFNGDRLKLTTPPTLYDGEEIIGVVIWERV